MEQNEELKELHTISLRELAIVVTLLFNFGALIWGAATLNNSVKVLGVELMDNTEAVRNLAKDLQSMNLDHTARIRVLEELVNNGAHK
jgi:hypothetical protein